MCKLDLVSSAPCEPPAGQNLICHHRRRPIFQGFILQIDLTIVAEPHQFYAAPAPDPGKNLYAALAPTLLYSKAKFLK
jgi:hypothetical protein